MTDEELIDELGKRHPHVVVLIRYDRVSDAEPARLMHHRGNDLDATVGLLRLGLLGAEREASAEAKGYLQTWEAVGSLPV